MDLKNEFNNGRLNRCLIDGKTDYTIQRLFDNETMSIIPITKENEKEYREAIVLQHIKGMYKDDHAYFIKKASGFSDEQMKKIYGDAFDILCDYIKGLKPNEIGISTLDKKELAKRVKNIPYGSSIIGDMLLDIDSFYSIVNYALQDEHKEMVYTDYRYSHENLSNPKNEIKFAVEDVKYPKVKTNQLI